VYDLAYVGLLETGVAIYGQKVGCMI
jgi:hypothetical protein